MSVGVYEDGMKVKDKYGNVYTISGTSTMPGYLKCIDDSTGQVSFIEYTELDYLDIPTGKCSCGAEKCGYNSHTDWCDKVRPLK